MKGLILILMLLFAFATLAVLIIGIIVMAKGGKLDKKYSNKLMVARVCFQGIAVLLLCLLFAIS